MVGGRRGSTNPQVTTTATLLLSTSSSFCLWPFPSYPPALISIRDADVDFATGKQNKKKSVTQHPGAGPILQIRSNTQDLPEQRQKPKTPVTVVGDSHQQV
jgi:hypothetical protein